MRLSEGVEWALHCCCLLASLPTGSSLPAARLAEFHGVPPAYLAKHLQALSRAGIITSVSGPRGGYQLARPADGITVEEVVDAVEGRTRAFRCSEIRQRGPAGGPASWYPAPCGIARVMWEAEDAWRRSLSGHTVAELAAAGVEATPREGLERAVRWVTEFTR